MELCSSEQTVVPAACALVLQRAVTAMPGSQVVEICSGAKFVTPAHCAAARSSSGSVLSRKHVEECRFAVSTPTRLAVGPSDSSAKAFKAVVGRPLHPAARVILLDQFDRVLSCTIKVNGLNATLVRPRAECGGSSAQARDGMGDEEGEESGGGGKKTAGFGAVAAVMRDAPTRSAFKGTKVLKLGLDGAVNFVDLVVSVTGVHWLTFSLPGVKPVSTAVRVRAAPIDLANGEIGMDVLSRKHCDYLYHRFQSPRQGSPRVELGEAVAWFSKASGGEKGGSDRARRRASSSAFPAVVSSVPSNLILFSLSCERRLARDGAFLTRFPDKSGKAGKVVVVVGHGCARLKLGLSVPSPRTPELEVLGLSSNASAYGVSVIRRAYRVASRQWHPDQWVGEQAWCRRAAAKALEVVQEAYQVGFLLWSALLCTALRCDVLLCYTLFSAFISFAALIELRRRNHLISPIHRPSSWKQQRSS